MREQDIQQGSRIRHPGMPKILTFLPHALSEIGKIVDFKQEIYFSKIDDRTIE